MIRLAILVLALDLANGQLNYEGNPFTEYTEYIAEESNLSENSARNNPAIDFSNSGMSSHPQKLYPIVDSGSGSRLQQVAETDNLLSDKSSASFSIQSFRSNAADVSSGRQFQVIPDQNSPINPGEVALNSFLNSQTPEESRVSLDHYLRSQQSPQDHFQPSEAIISQERRIEPFDIDQQHAISQIGQQQALVAPQVEQEQQVQLTSYVSPSQVVPQLMSQVNQRQQLMPQVNQRQQLLPPAVQAYNYAEQSAAVQPAAVQPASVQPTAVQPVIRAPAGVIVGQGLLHPVPLMSGFQTRNDIITPAMWRERMRRIRGKPFPYAQARIAPGLYKGPIAVPFKPKIPVEVIYTKPPGFYRGPPIISNPPIAYAPGTEDASAWFPDADHPPPPKDVYYSQLYAQSYDPHYYNYIGATGKIRPYLYGKLGKRQEEEETGIWSELYRGFKNHGLKNIMTPTFLLGMTLPVVTLMLSALVQKRSIARSDGARELDQEDALREYLERLQRAMKCYDGRSSRDAKLDGC